MGGNNGGGGVGREKGDWERGWNIVERVVKMADPFFISPPQFLPLFFFFLLGQRKFCWWQVDCSPEEGSCIQVLGRFGLFLFYLRKI